MRSPEYYRELAATARHLAQATRDDQLREQLEAIERYYDEIAEKLEQD